MVEHSYPVTVEQLAIEHLATWGADARHASMLAAFANRLLRTGGAAQQPQECLALIDARLADLREANDIFRKSSWDRGGDIQRNDREIRWLIDFRTTLTLPSTER